MKKNILAISALALTLGALTFVSCKKSDVTAPVVTLIGDESVTVTLNGTYAELGATATDNKDGKLTPNTEGVVDVNTAGVYVVTYSSTDAAGNKGTADRTVTVNNTVDAFWLGDFDGQETDALGPYTYAGNTNPAKVVKITPSTTVNNRIIINRLGDFVNNKVYMNVIGNTVNVPSQTVNSVGTGTVQCDVHNRITSSGNGIKPSGTSATSFTLTYSDAKTSGCLGSRNNVVAVFTKK